MASKMKFLNPAKHGEYVFQRAVDEKGNQIGYLIVEAEMKTNILKTDSGYFVLMVLDREEHGDIFGVFERIKRIIIDNSDAKDEGNFMQNIEFVHKGIEDGKKEVIFSVDSNCNFKDETGKEIDSAEFHAENTVDFVLVFHGVANTKDALVARYAITEFRKHTQK